MTQQALKLKHIAAVAKVFDGKGMAKAMDITGYDPCFLLCPFTQLQDGITGAAEQGIICSCIFALFVKVYPYCMAGGLADEYSHAFCFLLCTERDNQQFTGLHIQVIDSQSGHFPGSQAGIQQQP